LLLADAVEAERLLQALEVERVRIGGRLLAALHRRGLPPMRLLREAAFEGL
jgi:hypothetical protein